MTTKFSKGDRVRAYEGGGYYDGVVDGIWADGTIRVKLDSSDGLLSYHPKQLRRLVKRTKVVWESEYVVGIGEGGSGVLRREDDSILSNVALSKFIGKRVRIVITEAK